MTEIVSLAVEIYKRKTFKLVDLMETVIHSPVHRF